MGTWMVWVGVSLWAMGTGVGAAPWLSPAVAGCRVGTAGSSQSPGNAWDGLRLRMARDERGAVHVVGTAGDLRFEQHMLADRRVELRLRRGADSVGIGLGRSTVAVSRGGHTVELTAEAAGEPQWLAVQRVLAGSTAVFRFRREVAALPTERRRTVEGAAVLLADALLGWLGGDTQAPARMVEGWRDHRPVVRPAALVEAPSCYETWESQAIRTWEDYKLCVVEVWGLHDVCGFRFILAAEANWFELLGCIALPLKGLEP